MRALVLLMATLITGSGQPTPKQDSDYTPAAQSQVVSWQLKRLTPPSNLYVTVDDVLRVGAMTLQANEVVTISYRLLRAADGKVVFGQFTTGTLTSNVLAIKDQSMAEGFLLSVSCKAAVATTRGQTFVRLFLNPKALGAGQPGFMLMADYVTTAMAPGHPNGRILSPTEGPGWVHSAQYTNPARGHDWGETDISTVARRRLLSVSAVLVTSATAGSRFPRLQVLDNALNIVAEWTATTAIAPSTTVKVVWSPAPAFVPEVTTDLKTPLPDNFILPVGYSVQVTTNGLDTNAATGDAWTNIFAYYEEWLDNV